MTAQMQKNSSLKMQLVDQLRAFLPSSAVLFDTEDLKPYEMDGLSAYRQTPMVVAIPETEEQARKLLQACHAASVPVVARGAGTGLSGGALPRGDGVLLSMARFKKILHIDPLARIARVQTGVRNLAISEAAAQYGLYYAPDPSSQIVCTIGGNVAENSGGVHCLKYGLTVHNILRLRVLTMAGEVLEIGSEGLDSAGYDLLALMTGSEGMLGIITEITVKLLPKPERAQVVMAAYDDVKKAGAAVGDIIAAGIIPAGLEMMDRLAIQAAEDFVHAGYPLAAEAILLCELDGTNEEVSEGIMRVHDILLASGATSLLTAKDDAERLKLWAGRKAAFPAVGRISPDYYCIDGTIPRKQLPMVLARIRELSAEYGLRVANVFHAGDGNLHPLILYDAGKPGEMERTEELGGKILELCVEVGGTITGEHGVGLDKVRYMDLIFSPDSLATMCALRDVFDPERRSNPGKVVPVHACREWHMAPAAKRVST